MTVDISKYSDTFRRLGQEAVACAPEAWTRGRLTIAFDGSSLHYRLESDSSQSQAVATEQLGRLCDELNILMEKDGQRWSQCVLAFAKTPDDSWAFDVNFTYPE